jgi:alpha-1,2-mannosyltransferase
MALYLAGESFSNGTFDSIYPKSAIYNLSVPAAWRPLAEAHGLGDMALYPFIYPPLWAALLAPASQALSPQSFVAIATWVNPILLGLSSLLAWRILRPAIAPARWLILSLVLLLASPIGFIALFQNQPQILVSFLILLAIERAGAGKPGAAGTALALAASIKLYPVFFVILWIATGNRRAVLSFALIGAALAALSLSAAPWSLHLAFLSALRAVSDTVVLTNLVYTLDTALGQFALKGQFALSPSGAGYALKPLWLGVLNKALLVAVLIALWALARRHPNRITTNLWPLALILVSLFGPLAWAYHYLSVGFFLPALLLSPRTRLPAALLWLALSLPMLLVLSAIPLPFYAAQLTGTLALGGLALVYLRNTAHPVRNTAP